MNADIGITGTNAEVALGQWEFQVLGSGIRAGDDLWMARYILQRIAEMKGVSINFHPKPQKVIGMVLVCTQTFLINRCELLEDSMYLKRYVKCWALSIKRLLRLMVRLMTRD